MVVFFGAAMFFLAGPITNRSFRTRSSPADQSLEASRFESAALFVLAGYVLVFAIPDAVSVLFRVVAIHGLGAAVPTVMAGEDGHAWRGAGQGAVRVLAGLLSPPRLFSEDRVS